MILYLKESPYGKKYLGKTVQDPYHYTGTGVVWKKHLKKHNILPKDLKTTILFETEDKEEFKKVALKYSAKWDIVNNPDFCNLTVEEGQGGDTSGFIDYSKRNTHNPNPKGSKGFRSGYKRITKEKVNKYVSPLELEDYLRQGWTLGIYSDKPRGYKKDHKPWNTGKSGYSIGTGKTRNNGPQRRTTCPHCKKEGGVSNMTRHHFDNCKQK